MEALQIKDVEFNGAMIKAVQDVSRIIWVGVKWVCEGIGFSENKTDNERKKLSKDIVLSKGVKFYSLSTNRGNQEILCIQLDYLPLWLAKISITPTMQRDNPELVEKLVAYQLKAKDVLAAAFLPEITHTTQPEPSQRFIQIPLPDYSGILDRMDVMESFLLMKVAEQFSQSESRMKSLEQRMDDFTQNMTNLSRFIVDRMEKFDVQHKPEPVAPVVTVEQSSYSEDRKLWKRKVYKLMDDILLHDDKFAERADIYKHLYKLMRNEDGAVWEQYIKEYKAKYDMDAKPATIDVCYEDETLRSIFMSKLENLAFNCGAIDNSYIVDAPLCLVGDVMLDEVKHLSTDKAIAPTSEIIKPLIEIRQDTSMHGVVSYKQVYQYMSENYKVSWKHNETRYITKNGRKPSGRIAVVMDNPRLYRKFKNAVNDLINLTVAEDNRNLEQKDVNADDE